MADKGSKHGTVRRSRNSLFNVTGVDEFAFLTNKAVREAASKPTGAQLAGGNPHPDGQPDHHHSPPWPSPADEELSLHVLAEMIKEEIRQASGLRRALQRIEDEMDRFSARFLTQAQLEHFSRAMTKYEEASAASKRGDDGEASSPVVMTAAAAESKTGGKRVRLVVPDEIRFRWLDIFHVPQPDSDEESSTDGEAGTGASEGEPPKGADHTDGPPRSDARHGSPTTAATTANEAKVDPPGEDDDYGSPADSPAEDSGRATPDAARGATLGRLGGASAADGGALAYATISGSRWTLGSRRGDLLARLAEYHAQAGDGDAKQVSPSSQRRATLGRALQRNRRALVGELEPEADAAGPTAAPAPPERPSAGGADGQADKHGASPSPLRRRLSSVIPPRSRPQSPASGEAPTSFAQRLIRRRSRDSVLHRKHHRDVPARPATPPIAANVRSDATADSCSVAPTAPPPSLPQGGSRHRRHASSVGPPTVGEPTPRLLNASLSEDDLALTARNATGAARGRGHYSHRAAAASENSFARHDQHDDDSRSVWRRRSRRVSIISTISHIFKQRQPAPEPEPPRDVARG